MVRFCFSRCDVLFRAENKQEQAFRISTMCIKKWELTQTEEIKLKCRSPSAYFISFLSEWKESQRLTGKKTPQNNRKTTEVVPKSFSDRDLNEHDQSWSSEKLVYDFFLSFF